MKHHTLLRFTFLAVMLAAPASAQMLPGGKSSDKPVEITADTLEVLQEKTKAVFTGNVVAVQQDVRLKADRMIVHYRPSEQRGEAGRDAVSRIEVEGNVFLTTPKETASGKAGVYDVDGGEIRLNADVVLTQGNNVLKGSALTYNLASGKSSISGGAKPAAGAESSGTQRVRALFVPEKKEGATP